MIEGDNEPSFAAVLREASIIAQLAANLLEAKTPPGVLVSHFGVLSHLIRVQDGATPVELARAFQVPKTTMTHTLTGLSDRNWIAMRPNPRDARSKQAWLTEAGRTFVQDMIGALSGEEQEFSQEMPGLPDRILSDLTRLRRYLDNRRSGV